ncbi:MAG TPA: hypothetical protein VK174_03505 [Chitinophagales bacterium]|nr:hypothetical protein [Chitinophagales bacterium]HLP53042.1 hypothetical protein [Chitinophagales bacterium]
MTNRIRKIEKDQLKECAFQKPNDTHTDFEMRERNRRLYLAMLMGNNYESRVKIVFNTLEGYREIFTTVWATTEKYILLKGGSYIPLEAISYVELESTSQQHTNRIF